MPSQTSVIIILALDCMYYLQNKESSFFYSGFCESKKKEVRKMIVKEKEAFNWHCPMAYSSSFIERCQGSKCMAWIRLETRETEESYGFCGMVNKPY